MKLDVVVVPFGGCPSRADFELGTRRAGLARLLNAHGLRQPGKPGSTTAMSPSIATAWSDA